MIAFKIKSVIFSTMSIAFFFAISLATSRAEELEMPEDVADYIQSREICEHFRDEAGDESDASRKNEIEKGLENCKGTDAKLASLKYLHARSPEIMARLRHYETLIEGNERGLPEDVWSYLTARIQCDRLLADPSLESPFTDAKFHGSSRDRVCTRANDRLLSGLKSKHSRNQVVMEALSEFAPLHSRSLVGRP